MFKILVTDGAEDDLRALPARARRTVVDAIERSLAADADVPARNRKLLAGLRPPWASVPPIWELRVGDYRVFYDVDGDEGCVYIRAVRHKPPHKRTEEIL